MSTPGTEAPPVETPSDGTPPNGTPPDQTALIASLQKQNQDLAEALRNSTQTQGLGGTVERRFEAPAQPQKSLQDQLRELDEDERYMNMSASQKSAVAAQLLYQAQIAPEAAKLKRQGAANALMLFKTLKAQTKNSAKILEIFERGLAPIDQIANLEGDDLQKYLEGIWLQAKGTLYDEAERNAPPPREEPINLGGGAGRAAPLGGGGAPTNLTIDMIDDRTIKLGRQLGYDDEKIIKMAQKAIEQEDEY